tara:strand:- start:458 stop:742 length:285 start_codon:yes stop_codon:yes gene_type:complete
MTHKQKAQAFKKKFQNNKSVVTERMTIIENPVSVRTKGKKGYSSISFILERNPKSTLKFMREFMKSHGQTNLDLKKGVTLRTIGTYYTAFFKND